MSDLNFTVPLITREQFSKVTGLAIGVIEKQCERGYWPTVKVGKYSMINMAVIHEEALKHGREHFTFGR